MNGWTVTLHPLAESELMALPADMKARFLRISELLEDCGPQRVGMPHIRPIQGKLWEMRMAGRDGIARAVGAEVQRVAAASVVHINVPAIHKQRPAFVGITKRGVAAFLAQVIGFGFDNACTQPVLALAMTNHLAE